MSVDVHEGKAAPGVPAGIARVRDRLRAVVLLAGSVRASELSRTIDRSLLDLPIEPGRSVLAHWQLQAEALAAAFAIPNLPIRVIVDHAARAPQHPAGSSRVSIERDAAQFRGTGGVLRDLSAAYGPRDLLIVANAAQILIEPLTTLVANLEAAGGQIGLVAHDDGAPVGLMLIACEALARIQGEGFVDFKEQVLPRLATGTEVRVVRRPHATGIAIRTLEGYLAGVRAHHRLGAGLSAIPGAFEEDWSPTFSHAEPGALVEPGAVIHDSVVLAGGRVGRGALVVRSVVAPGGVVPPGVTVVESTVGRPVRPVSIPA